MAKEGNLVYFLDAFVIPFLTQALGFSYEILSPPDNSFGSSTPSGKWTGLIGMVQSGEADIAIGIMITENRSLITDFTFPYVYTDVTFVTDNPQYLPKNLAILQPFSAWMWFSLALFLTSISFLIFAFLRRRYDYVVVLIASFGILLENALGVIYKKPNVRFLMFPWIIGALFITNCYKAVLLAALSFPLMTGIYDVKDLSEASNKPSFRCRTMPGSYLYNVLMRSTDALYGPIGQCVRRNSWDTRSNDEFLDDPNVKKVLMTTRRVLMKFHLTHFLSEDSFFPCPVAIAVGKKFCCKKALDKAIHRLLAFGLLQKCENDVFFYSSASRSALSSSNNANSSEELSLEDLSGAFIVLVVGLMCSAVVLIVEIIVHKMKRQIAVRNATYCTSIKIRKS